MFHQLALLPCGAGNCYIHRSTAPAKILLRNDQRQRGQGDLVQAYLIIDGDLLGVLRHNN